MPLNSCILDPAPLFDLYRGRLSTEILCAVACRTRFFRMLGNSGMSFAELARAMNWSDRALNVVLTALRAMEMVEMTSGEVYRPTDSARLFLDPGSEFALAGYLGLSAHTPAVDRFVEALESQANKPDSDAGTAFTYRPDKPSAMDDPETARFLTLSLAGRGRCVAPELAAKVPLNADEKVLIDIGGGSGWYSIAYLKAHPHAKAVVWDRPEVLKVAQENAVAEGVADRLECIGGDMFVDKFPVDADVLLVSNILHDWDLPEVDHLLRHWLGQSRHGARLILHDVFLNDALDGPLPIALYSADLFLLTEGRAYSRAEYLDRFDRSGWNADPNQSPIRTLAHCGVLQARANH
ncbi:methyltransferase [bacterium]|nr:methyltransferase [bacterium]